jgi:catechol 2,3-dioxygenase
MSASDVLEASARSDFFRPRRLGHANIFISDYERAAEFYSSVVGIREAYRQPDNRASFVSNGNTYHDFGLTAVDSRYARPGQKAGALYHLAFELENEADLVEGYNRSIAAGHKYKLIQDHDVAHSLYLPDPEGNMVEIYADVMKDWRSNRHGVIIKEKPEWIPGVTNVPQTTSCYPENVSYDKVDDALFHAKRVTNVGLVVRDLAAGIEFYSGFCGLRTFAGGPHDPYVVFGGTVSDCVITLFRARPGLTLGLHHVGLEAWDEADLDRSLKAAPGSGVEVERDLSHPARRVVSIRDPDGIRLKFYVDRDWSADRLRGLDEETARFLL